MRLQARLTYVPFVETYIILRGDMAKNEVDGLIENSKCKECEHVVSRIVIPMDYEEFGISLEELQGELDAEDYDENNDRIAVVHNTCSILNMDLNHIVVECNKYLKTNNITFLKNNPYKIG